MKKLFLFLIHSICFIHNCSAYGSPVNFINAGPAHASFANTGFSSTGVTVAGGTTSGSANNQLLSPRGIFIDAAGNLYIADQYNHRIQKWAPGANEGVTVAGGNGQGITPAQLNSPLDVFVDPTGNIFIDEGDAPRIQKWIPGALSGTTVAGGNGRGSAANQLNDPYAIYLDAAGNIYISDQINSRVQKWAPGALSGVTVIGNAGAGSAANQILFPGGIFIDRLGNIYVCDGGNNRVQKWAPGAATGVTVAGGNGAGTAANQLTPNDVFVDQAGNVFVTDLQNNRVQKWAPGALEGVTVAGGNGQGSAANQLYAPSSVCLDQFGNMYVSDNGNNRIQKYAADLVFTAPSCNATAIITWPRPLNTFPASIKIPEELDLNRGMLTYIDTLQGHAYYKSSFVYPWPVAKDIAFYIGDTSVNGHLLTLNSPVENNFIYNKIKGSGYSPWIGLYNTGKPGMFAWVTGETTGYTNWAPGEPNNGSPGLAYVKEPYVRLADGYGTWNDQRTDNEPFIAEFEAPLIRYEQVSGPANGSAQPVGTYQVCYEKKNSITGEKETSCFNVQVICSSSVLSVPGIASAAATDKNIVTSATGWLSVSASPNPSGNYFRLKIAGTSAVSKIQVIVTDVSGKIIESKKSISAGETIDIGAGYYPGIYFAQVIDGNNKVMIKMVKQ